MDLEWDDLRTVTCLVEEKTLAATGARLGLNYTTVARRIQRAEAQLGQTLFEKLADGYVPTEAALILAQSGAEMEQHHNAALRQISGLQETVAGPLTVTAPQLLIAHLLAPFFETFVQDYPQVDLRVRATNDLLDLSRREADLAIRVSNSPGDALTGVRLAEQRNASFATQTWADRIANDPNGPIDWIVFEGHPDLPKGVAEAYPGSRVRYVFDDMVAILGAVQAGLGVARVPFFLARSAGLVQVPVSLPRPYADIWVVAHPDLWRGRKVSAFKDGLVPFMKARRAMFLGEDGC